MLRLAELAPHVAAGKLRALAVTTAARTEVLKDVPTVAEAGDPGFDASFWFGAWVPTGTPKEVINRLHTEVLRALDGPEVKEIIMRQGYSPAPTSLAQLDAFYRDEIARSARVVNDPDLRLE